VKKIKEITIIADRGPKEGEIFLSFEIQKGNVDFPALIDAIEVELEKQKIQSLASS